MDTLSTLSSVGGPLTDPRKKPKIFRTVEIGTCQNVEFLRRALEESDAWVGRCARDILNRAKLSKSRQSLGLVVLSVRELGFPRGAQLQDIYRAADSQGLGLCPAEVGPQLRLQYPDQPNGELLEIAMEPIRDSVGGLNLFSVRRFDEGRWLSSIGGRPDRFWDADRRFVFVRRE